MDIEPPKEVELWLREPFDFFQITFSPLFRSGKVIKYYGDWKNLRLELWYDKLKIKNSWHKFYHGNNYGDYTHQEIVKTFQIFVDRFGSGFLEARILKMTIGCNLSLDPLDFYPNCVCFGPKFFQEMRYGSIHKVYGKYVKQTNTKFKIYDKQTEVEHHDRKKISPTLRIEQEMKMRYIHQSSLTSISVHCPADLTKSLWIQETSVELKRLVQKIEFSSEIPTEESDSFIDFQIKRLMGNPIDRKMVKIKSDVKTYRKWAKRYREFLDAYQTSDLKLNLIDSICQKILLLGKCDKTDEN